MRKLLKARQSERSVSRWPKNARPRCGRYFLPLRQLNGELEPQFEFELLVNRLLATPNGGLGANQQRMLTSAREITMTADRAWRSLHAVQDSYSHSGLDP